MELIVDVDIKVVDEGLPQEQAVACGKVASLEDEMMTVFVRFALALAQSSTLLTHIIAPLVSNLNHRISEERTMIDDAAGLLQVALSVDESVVDTVGNADVAEVLDKLPELLTINLTEDSDEDSYFH